MLHGVPQREESDVTSFYFANVINVVSKRMTSRLTSRQWRRGQKRDWGPRRGRNRKGCAPGPVGVAARGPYQLEADLPVLPVHWGIVVPQAGRRAACPAGRRRQGRVPQALQGVRQDLPEVTTAAGMGPEGAGGVVFVQVEERLLCDAVQLLQLPFNLGVPGMSDGERAGLGADRTRMPGPCGPHFPWLKWMRPERWAWRVDRCVRRG